MRDAYAELIWFLATAVGLVWLLIIAHFIIKFW